MTIVYTPRCFYFADAVERIEKRQRSNVGLIGAGRVGHAKAFVGVLPYALWCSGNGS